MVRCCTHNVGQATDGFSEQEPGPEAGGPLTMAWPGLMRKKCDGGSIDSPQVGSLRDLADAGQFCTYRGDEAHPSPMKITPRSAASATSPSQRCPGGSIKCLWDVNRYTPDEEASHSLGIYTTLRNL
jgi:hypothetical protein